MNWKDWKEISQNALLLLGMVALLGACIALIVGIPAVAIVWIVEALTN